MNRAKHDPKPHEPWTRIRHPTHDSSLTVVCSALLALTLIGVGSSEADEEGEADASRRFQIHPSIGIARVGDSTSDYYLAPDSWHRDFIPEDGYRDAEGKIKRMGVRFRIYELDADGEVLGEVTATANVEIQWRVHLVNKKAAKDHPFGSGTPLNPEDPATMTIDPGVQEIAGDQREVEVSGFIGPSAEIEVKLGDLKTDDDGRLVVLGGHGAAGSWKASPLPPGTVHNPDWFDDTSDGPVRATILITEGDSIQSFEARSAWVVVAPPDYAHPVMNLVTLYDVVRDRSDPAPVASTVSFTSDVYPILRRVPHQQWTLMAQLASRFGRTAMHAHGIQGTDPVLAGAHQMHRGGGDFFDPKVFLKLHINNPSHPRFAEAQGLRMHVLDRLKDPRPGGATSGGIGEPHSMPAVEQLTLTPTQYETLSRWRDDLFVDDWDRAWNPVDPPADFEPEFEPLSLADQPAALDRAALEGGMGGPFAPGIDAGVLLADETTYDEPFHISLSVVAPGDVTERLGVPWQAGFNMATGQWAPGARPVYVIVKTDEGYTTEFWTRPYTAQVPLATAPAGSSVMDSMDFEGINANQRMVHNLCMVDHWKHLGFLARDLDASELMYIETERAPGF